MAMNPPYVTIYPINGQYYKSFAFLFWESILFCVIHLHGITLINKPSSFWFNMCQHLPYTIVLTIFLFIVLQWLTVYLWKIWFSSINIHISIWSWLFWWIFYYLFVIPYELCGDVYCGFGVEISPVFFVLPVIPFFLPFVILFFILVFLCSSYFYCFLGCFLAAKSL